MKKLNYLICLLIVFTFLFPEYNFAKDNRNNPNKKKTEKTLPESNESVQTTIKVLDPDDDSAKEIINIFLENSPRRFLDPGAPRFAVEGKDKKYYFGIGGFVKGTAAYDFGNPIESPVYFSPS